MADVFISYTRSDAAAAQVIALALKGRGLSVFYDANIATGDAWDERIEREAHAARAVAVLWSEVSRDREWVRNEARVGKKRGVLWPARLDNCELPIEFSHLQTADLAGLFPNQVAAFCDSIAEKLAATAVPDQPTHIARDLPQHWADQLEEEIRRVRETHRKFDASKLHPEVRGASDAARRAEIAAVRSRHRALWHYDRAEQSARNARTGVAGAGNIRLLGGDLYEGDIPKGRGLFLKMSGFGIRTTSEDGPHKGDRYAGQFVDGRASGCGVYVYGRNSNNRNSLRYEGELALDRKSGVGVFLWRNGDRYAGTFADDVISGPGVHLFADGRRQEGYALDWFSDGYGVEWSADGVVLKAGIWSRNRMIRALAQG